MQGLNGILFHGLLKSTALVVSSNAPVAVQVAARLAHVVFGNRIQICDGINDHVEIQAALDALPATGGEVYLLEGTYNCQVTINLDSNQTLRGCGRSTTLTTVTNGLFFLSAVGGAGTELTGIVIADLHIDGATVTDTGIYFEFVDYSFIQNVRTRRHQLGAVIFATGIYMLNSDYNVLTDIVAEENSGGIELRTSCFNSVEGCTTINNPALGIELLTAEGNTVTGNICSGGFIGISLNTSSPNNTITGNTCEANTGEGIFLAHNGTKDNTVSANICAGNTNNGIYLDTCGPNNAVVGNTCQGNGQNGICMDDFVNYCNITGNTCEENSQSADNTFDDIHVGNCSYNTIQGNICKAGALANKPQYGINIADNACSKNIIAGNDVTDDGFGTGSFNDAGVLTHVEDNNQGIRLDQIRHFRTVKNTSGAQRVAGDVVSLKAVANGYEVTAPAAVGERQVFGMVAETINDNDFGLVQTKGKTTELKSTNAGGGNIVIGDNLITENGVRARKAAAATDPIFARALEACAAANCTIDAYIKSPWD